MKKEELFEAMEGIDPALVVEAENARGKKSIWRSWMSVAAGIVLVAGLAVGIWALTGDFGFGGGAKAMALPKYPDAFPAGENLSDTIHGKEYREWKHARNAMATEAWWYRGDMEHYYTQILGELLPAEDENTVCSPINLYFACAMLAEVTGGESRQQILDMLGVSDMEKLREMSTKLWEANYADSPIVKSILANSLWMDNNCKYNKNTLERLAKTYYAASYRGEMGSQEINELFRNWINENTGDLLTEYTEKLELPEETVMAIVSTIYFNALWTREFSEEATKTEVFHGVKGDTEVQMMNNLIMNGTVFVGEGYRLFKMDLEEGGSMHFILPDEGVDVNTLSKDPMIVHYLLNGLQGTVGIHDQSGNVHISIPKFKVSQDKELSDVLKKMGVKDVFDGEKANFTPLTEGDVALSVVDHAATLEINEKGVKGAAYTIDLLLGFGGVVTEDVYFTLDRPFMFAVTGPDTSILFSGIVRNIE